MFAGILASLVGFKVASRFVVGPEWDAYAFLVNAADWAGRGVGYTEPHRPPFMSWVASLPMRFGLLDQRVIQAVDGLLSFGAAIIFFLLLRRRFSAPVAAGGSIALIVADTSWKWLGTGYTDLPSVGVSLAALLFLIKATEEDDRWYWAAGAAFAAAVLTRYTALLAAFPMIVWLLLRWRPFAQIGRIGQAVLVGVAVYAPAGRAYLQRFGDVLFPFLVAAGMVESVATEGGEAIVSQAGGVWYLRKLATLMGPSDFEAVTWFIVVLAVWGLAGSAWLHLREHRPTGAKVFGALVALGVPLLAQGGGGGLLARQGTIVLGILGLWSLLAREDEQDGRRRVPAASALTATMLAWFLVYLDFHGHQLVQVERYIIPMAPGIIFLVILGWDALVRGATPALPGRSAFLRREALIPLALWLVLAAGSSVLRTSHEPQPMSEAARLTAEWILENGELTDDTVVVSDTWPHTSWYLRHPARPMPGFEDGRAFEHELEKTKAAYYVTYRALQPDGYTTGFAVETDAAESDSFRVLVSEGAITRDVPTVQQLGTAWPVYIESLTEFEFQLDHSEGRYGWEGSAFLDAFTTDELARADAVFVYGVRWRDRGAGEDALRAYIESGGTAVIDASANLSGMWYSLRDVVMYDTVIRGKTLPASVEVDLNPAFAARHPEVRSGIRVDFVDEDGGPWGGASYTPLDADAKREVLVEIAGEPAVVRQDLGAGRVYWIGFNLVWHAHSVGGPDERALIRAVLREAIRPVPAATTDIAPAPVGP